MRACIVLCTFEMRNSFPTYRFACQTNGAPVRGILKGIRSVEHDGSLNGGMSARWGIVSACVYLCMSTALEWVVCVELCHAHVNVGPGPVVE